MNSKINVFIVNWNSSAAVNKSIEKLLLSDYDSFRIFLIDNFYSKNELNEILKIFSKFKNLIEIHLIQNSFNLGYAGGNNSGYLYIEKNKISGNILIINPDVEVMSNTISEMSKYLFKDVGIVSVRTCNSKGFVLYDAIKLYGFFQKLVCTTNLTIYSDYAQGSCMLIDRELISKIGLFDERFFLYWEEVDFSLRVRKFGKKIVSITSTSVIREDNDSQRSFNAYYYWIRNSRLILENHKEVFPIISYLIFIIFNFFLLFRNLLSFNLFLTYFKIFFQAFSDSLRNKYGIKGY
jgi:GT2 family glycosyltransferase